MIQKQTTIFLGAGSSIPYGFPSGLQLMKDIVNVVQGQTKLFQYLGFNPEFRNEFCRELIRSQSPSIDFFLNKRPEFITIGKLSIFLCINQNEYEGNLILDPIQRKGIYPYLYKKMVSNCDDLSQNKISFITLNYDRSLEHYLYSAWKSLTNQDANIVEKMIDRIPIVHLYGTVGGDPYKPYGLPYQPIDLNNEAYISEIFSDSQKLQIISDNEKEELTFNTATQILSNSEKIYFIGFGYHTEILYRLKLEKLRYSDSENIKPGSNLKSINAFRGSCKGLGHAEMEEINKTWNIYLPDNKLDGLEFLSKYGKIE